MNFFSLEMFYIPIFVGAATAFFKFFIETITTYRKEKIIEAIKTPKAYNYTEKVFTNAKDGRKLILDILKKDGWTISEEVEDDATILVAKRTYNEEVNLPFEVDVKFSKNKNICREAEYCLTFGTKEKDIVKIERKERYMLYDNTEEETEGYWFDDVEQEAYTYTKSLKLVQVNNWDKAFLRFKNIEMLINVKL